MSVPSAARVRALCQTALLAAVLVLCAWLTLPLGPLVFTMQTFGVFAALGLLGGKRGTAAFLLYLCLGLVGLPVFSGFSAGPGVLLGPTGGYLAGFLASGLVFWGVTARWGDSLRPMAAGMGLGLLACYAVGTAWFLLVYARGTTLLSALSLCVFPYVLPDALKIALALVVVRRVGKFVRL